MALVEDAVLQPRLEFYRPLPTWLRLDVLPFGFLYATFGGCAACVHRGHGFSLLLALVGCVHALAFFSSEWSVRIKCWLGYTCVAFNPTMATRSGVFVKVVPSRRRLPRLLCRLHRDEPSPKLRGQTVLAAGTLWFAYQKLRFCLDDDSTFRRLEYPTAEPLASYVAAMGYHSRTALEAASLKWQTNALEIPIPAFSALLKEHLVAPFFVFQFLCTMLWCLDDYVYYSLLTLLMLVLFECTVVKQRQHNMELLHHMQRPPSRLYVYRLRKWLQVSSTELVPGDVASFGRAVGVGRHDDVLAPCDVLLLQGACVVNEAMLSGESVPLRKEPLRTGDYAHLARLHMNTRHRKHVVFGGTKLLQHTPYARLDDTLSIPEPPDRGCLVYVLRTGFATTQGDLLRAILFAAPRLTATNRESMYFILFLLCFAVAASAVVLVEGAKDPSRSQFKLFLHCVMIITSVVPPELPMELSLAVTNSLLSLARMAVFCTEPFRIPLAGKVDVVCFDKTGTLTSDALEMRGVAGLSASALLPVADPLSLVPPGTLPADVQIVLASCHSLMVLNGGIAGDPLEKTVLAHLPDWRLHQLDRLTARYPFGTRSLRIVHRFGFASELKRMSALVLLDDGAELRLVAKGAPEVMEALYASVPTHYTSVYRNFALKGARVLALGYRKLPVTDLARIRQLVRAETETGLVFAGFLVLDCPLKGDTKRVVQELQLANHRTVMVTGDSALTACEVARQVGMLPHAKTLVLEVAGDGAAWVDPFGAGAPRPLEPTAVAQLGDAYNLCLTGEALPLVSDALLQALTPHAQVFARTSPDQKARVLAAFNAAGLVTAMCGDGTNDVGALKTAHVGISVVNEAPRRLAGEAALFGDASMASPFTSKGGSIRCTANVLRQGRCTLVTTLQMYKILGVNCLVSAYALSCLYLYGVKQGDTQLTVSGLLVALCFLFLSYATPATDLSHERPVSRVFCASVLLSIVLQFGVHLLSLVVALAAAAPLVDFNDPALHADATFQPNALNTIMFLLATLMQINTFVANYKGRPFMQSFHENKLLSRCAYVSYAVVGLLVVDAVPRLGASLELVPLPTREVQFTVLAIMLLDTVAVLALEHLIQVLTTAYPGVMT
ncbi:P-type ATPase (P-ATPase) Superfamily [Achlya hypogyna]|uniref:P-type ATPase (P-ATPase) Superfamily n=1 Tax=Achlya hypogyna TaxID=1202772 RepID=A0A1V9YCL1_ACHHY|nr:P-type ATPase (P-ATPase) Superfamily [Achlya hypogyna]